MTGSAAWAPVTVEGLDPRDDRAVSDFYRHVLLPHFPADELETEEAITAGLREGGAMALVARAPGGEVVGGEVVGGAVCDWFPRSGVLLLSYIAVSAPCRDRGVGRALLEAVRGTWTAGLAPRLIVAEVEDPRHHHDTGYGNPARRASLYQRIGALALPIPFFQPALGDGRNRVPHLMLMVLGGTQAPPGTRWVDGRLVERFLAEYLEACEGPARPDDADVQRLFAACRQPGGLPLLTPSALPDTTGG